MATASFAAAPPSLPRTAWLPEHRATIRTRLPPDPRFPSSERDAMAYMNCPCCGLSIRLRASYLAMERCPRCLVRRKAVVAMYISERPGGTKGAEAPRHGAQMPEREHGSTASQPGQAASPVASRSEEV